MFIQKAHYKSYNQLAGGIITGLNAGNNLESLMKEDETSKDGNIPYDEETDENNEKMINDSMSTSARVLQFKQKRYNVEQVAQEVLKVLEN